MKKQQIANLFRYTARAIISILGVLIFLFALISGADLEKGVMGVVRNIPNTLPCIILLVVIWQAWKRELLGGILIITLGLIGGFFFSIWNNLFEFVFWLIISIIILGAFFIISWWLRRN